LIQNELFDIGSEKIFSSDEQLFYCKINFSLINQSVWLTGFRAGIICLQTIHHSDNAILDRVNLPSVTAKVDLVPNGK
jgi:hypothetical protein